MYISIYTILHEKITIKNVAQGFSLSYRKIRAKARAKLFTGRTKLRKAANLYGLLRKDSAQSRMWAAQRCARSFENTTPRYQLLNSFSNIGYGGG